MRLAGLPGEGVGTPGYAFRRSFIKKKPPPPCGGASDVRKANLAPVPTGQDGLRPSRRQAYGPGSGNIPHAGMAVGPENATTAALTEHGKYGTRPPLLQGDHPSRKAFRCPLYVGCRAKRTVVVTCLHGLVITCDSSCKVA